MKRVLYSVLGTCVVAASCVALSTSSASADFLYTYVPDDAFEQRLINLGYDDTLDNQVRTTTIRQITSLDLSVLQ